MILVVGSNRERVQNHFENSRDCEVNISYAIQDQQLGIEHALLQAESRVGDSFVVPNGDCVVHSDAIEHI